MQGYIKKIYLSLLAFIVVFLTTVITTYAWVGIFTYSSTDSFNINLKVEDLNQEYFLTISNSGEVNTFSDSVELQDVQVQILENMSINYKKYLTDINKESINLFFNDKVRLEPVTTTINTSTNEIEDFYSIRDLIMFREKFEKSNKFFKFDLYLSVDSKEGIQNSTEIDADVALENIEESLEGLLTGYTLKNGNVLDLMPSYVYETYPILKNIPSQFNINSKSSARFALSIYSPIDINSNYENQKPVKTIIYQGGTSLPSLEKGVYSLGGILPEEYNFALQEVNRMYNKNLKIDTKIKERNDLELIENNRFIWMSEEENEYLGVKNGTQTKMKITVYFWFEGWDADCISAIDQKSVSLNLKFTSDIEQ